MITGSRFTGATAVSFGGTAALTFVVNSDTEIVADSPSQAPGVVDVVVTTPAGTNANTAADDFVYYDPPPLAEPASLIVQKAGGEAGILYQFELTHGALTTVSRFELAAGESKTVLLYIGSEWQLIELTAPAGVSYSGTCAAPTAVSAPAFECFVTNPSAVAGQSAPLPADTGHGAVR